MDSTTLSLASDVQNNRSHLFVGEPIPDTAKTAFIVLGVFLMISGFLGNLLILVTLAKCPSLHSLHYMYVANLAIADIIVETYSSPFILYDLILGYHPVINRTHCTFNGFLVVTCYVSSLLTLASISFNRYMNVCQNAIYNRYITRRITLGMLVLVWVLSVAVAAGPLAGWGRYGYNTKTHYCGYDRTASFSYTMLIAVGTVGAPASAVCYFNYSIFRYVRQARISLNKWKKATQYAGYDQSHIGSDSGSVSGVTPLSSCPGSAALQGTSDEIRAPAKEEPVVYPFQISETLFEEATPMISKLSGNKCVTTARFGVSTNGYEAVQMGSLKIGELNVNCQAAESGTRCLGKNNGCCVSVEKTPSNFEDPYTEYLYSTHSYGNGRCFNGCNERAKLPLKMSITAAGIADTSESRCCSSCQKDSFIFVEGRTDSVPFTDRIKYDVKEESRFGQKQLRSCCKTFNNNDCVTNSNNNLSLCFPMSLSFPNLPELSSSGSDRESKAYPKKRTLNSCSDLFHNTTACETMMMLPVCEDWNTRHQMLVNKKVKESSYVKGYQSPPNLTSPNKTSRFFCNEPVITKKKSSDTFTNNMCKDLECWPILWSPHVPRPQLQDSNASNDANAVKNKNVAVEHLQAPDNDKNCVPGLSQENVPLVVDARSDHPPSYRPTRGVKENKKSRLRRARPGSLKLKRRKDKLHSQELADLLSSSESSQRDIKPTQSYPQTQMTTEKSPGLLGCSASGPCPKQDSSVYPRKSLPNNSTSSSSLNGARNQPKSPPLSQKDLNMIKTLFTVFVCMAAFMSPYMVTTVADVHDRWPALVHFTCSYLAVVNNALNWMLYCMLNASFRSGYRHVMLSLCFRGHRKHDVPQVNV